MRSKSNRYSCQILTKLEFSRQILEECLNIKYRENPFSESRGVPFGQTDQRTELTKIIVAFREYVYCGRA